MYNSDYLSTLEWLGNEFRGVNRDLDRGTKARYYYNTVADNENDETTCQINKTLIYTFCRILPGVKKYRDVLN